ncbi:DnaD domain-containing protein [Cytobacillus praedii]|uniref:DnaD domain protein n=1 Tax=Cytobacillus praedii TaxID=1742358 RepID=A0A4R1B4P8_9BACI|nr:DnaD domain protein [Cytobacillus praedii]TCJ05067.1 DnaD domain protein [Cytobacillus praedii]
MAKFRMIHTEFWDDPRVVEEMTPEDKFFFLYLLTNKNTTQIGIYQITKKQMAFDMGYSIESINSLLERFINHHKIITYNSETREIAIKNWGKYNFNRGGKPVLDCVSSELKNVKDISLIPFVGAHVKKGEIKRIYDSYTIRERNEEDEQQETDKRSDMLLNQPFDDTSATRGQEEEKEKEKEEEKEKQQEEQKNNSENPFRFFEDNGFGTIGGYIAQKISKWCDDLSEELVLEAMKIAVERGAKNWSYVEKILINWAEKKIQSINQAKALTLAYKEKQAKQGNFRRSFATRTEMLPDWFDEQEDKQQPISPKDNTIEVERKRAELEETLKKLREGSSTDGDSL